MSTRPIILRVLLCALALGSGLLALADPAEARKLFMEEFGANIEVHADGRITVEERLRVRFDGSWNGVLRNIQTDYQYAGGVRGKIRLTLGAVTLENGTVLRVEQKRKGGELRLRIHVPEAVDTTKTVVIRYDCLNVIRRYEGEDTSFGGHDELYWNVTGNGSMIPIEKAWVRVTLPEAVDRNSVHFAIHAGMYGGAGAHGTAVGGLDLEGRVYVKTSRTLQIREGLTIVVGFPPGHVALPSLAQRAKWFLVDNWYVPLPLLLLLLWFLWWYRKGRDSLAGRTIIPEFEPPGGMRPAEIGVLIDDQFDQRDLAATVVDLAVRGILTIQYSKSPNATRLHLDRKAFGHTKLSDLERGLVKALFGKEKTERKLGDLKHRFHQHLPKLREQAEDMLVERGLFPARPASTIAKWQGLTVLALIVLGGCGFFFGWAWPFWVAMAVSTIPLFRLARYMPKRTPAGLDALARTRGLTDYLDTAERERMKAMPLAQAEALIPYALALGVEDRWLEAFGEVFAEAPEWANGKGGAAVNLDHVLNNLGRGVRNTLYSGPRVQSSSSGSSWSGGSGFSGGGFSGGGFGGGSVGGF